MNNQVLHLANQGVTINEIHNVYEVPKGLQDKWFCGAITALLSTTAVASSSVISDFGIATRQRLFRCRRLTPRPSTWR